MIKFNLPPWLGGEQVNIIANKANGLVLVEPVARPERGQITISRSLLIAVEIAEPATTPCPEGFHWIGQSGAWCDKCGLPGWEHDGFAVLKKQPDSPFYDPTWVLRPWDSEERRQAFKKRWEPDLLERQQEVGQR